MILDYKKLIKAHSDLKDSIKSRDVTHHHAIETSKETVKNLNSFYFYLASLSFGAIVLSITFVGNFKNFSENIVTFINYDIPAIYFLFLGWFTFLTSGFTSLYRNLSNINYIYYDAEHQWLQSIVTQKQKIIESKETGAFYNPEDINNSKEEKLLKKYRAIAKNTKRKKEREYFCFGVSEKIARWSFIVGALSLIIFAVGVLS